MVTVKRKMRSFTWNSLDHQCHSHHRNTQLALENAWLAPQKLAVNQEDVLSGALQKGNDQRIVSLNLIFVEGELDLN